MIPPTTYQLPGTRYPVVGRLVTLLRSVYGAPKRPPTTNAFEYYLWDRVGYLFDDAKRLAAFDALRDQIGLRPDQIHAAPVSELSSIAAIGGIEPKKRAMHMREAADLVLYEWGGDLDAICGAAIDDARRHLKQLPMTADAGADRILMFSGKHRVLGLESNGLRVLQRIGYGVGAKSFSATYRAVRDGLAKQLPKETGRLIDAHLLLQQHGRTTCRSARPMCDGCVLRHACSTGRSRQ